MTESSSKSENLPLLKRQRGAVKGSITRIKKMLDSATKFDPNELQCRLELFTSYMDQAMSCQTEIELIDAEDEKRAELEELCISTKARLLSLLNNHKTKESTLLDTSLGIALPSSSRLPNLKLPSFSGKYCNYKNFISSFKNLVHDEPNLSSIEKFNHLLSCLTGDALRTVKAFQVTEENYSKVLARLEERYDKKTLIFFDNIENLFEISKVSTPDASSLRNIVDTVSAILGSLLSLGSEKEVLNAFIIYLVISKVDPGTKAKWNEDLDYSVLPTWEDCAKTLIRRSQSLEVNEDRNCMHEKSFLKRDKRRRNGRSVLTCNQSENEKICLYCKAPKHNIQDCGNFSSISVADRFDFAKKNSCCLNCLKIGHVVARCKLARCRICNRPHHYLLHRYTSSPNTTDSVNTVPQPPSTSLEVASRRTIMQILGSSTILLATAVVQVQDRFGNFQLARALLDSGSQLNLMTKECSRRLNLKLESNYKSLKGVGTVSLKSSHKVMATVRSRINSFEFRDEFTILENICSYQPDVYIAGIGNKIPKNITLADPTFNKSQKIDMLLGTDVFFEILSIGQIKLGNSLPKLQKTLLGWIVAGKSNTVETNCYATCNLANSSEASDVNGLEHFVKKFWELEELPNRLNKQTEEHLQCEAHYKNNVNILPSGRFEVKLPFKENSDTLGSSFETAKRRFLSLERRLSKTPEIKAQYKDFMNEYLLLGHMSELTNFPSFPYYFIPHQCVLRPQSTSTKLRVVFDASCRSSTQISLNEILMVGPTIQPELYCTLLRFRCYKYALTADISKMYRQVMINPADRKYQLILWRENENQPIKMFSLNTVTYGTAPAPFLAIRCLKELSILNKERYPIGSQVIENHFYVDDLLTGADNLKDLEIIRQQVVTILKSAGFELAKWRSNNKQLEVDNTLGKELPKGDIEYTKTLGMTWFSHDDFFEFELDFDFENLKATKRNILSLSARLFDPLGLLNPIILKSKVMLQELWQAKLDWDESVPMAIETAWQELKATLKIINQIKIPRYINTRSDTKVQIHGFADSSETAYGCCIYVRAITGNEVLVQLVTAKSKVAPLKKRSLPRLELCAAHMLSKLWKVVEHIFLPYTEKIYFWSDSEIVLYWLKKYPSTLSTFVGNRVADIQEWSSDVIWKHVPSSDNPADIASRGCTVDKIQSSIWFTGPQFLRWNDSMWPRNSHIEPSEEEKCLELRKVVKKCVMVMQLEKNIINEIVDNLSSYIKILRVVAYVYRFLEPTQVNRSDPSITANELSFVFLKVVETIQKQEFSEEIKCVKDNSVIKSSIQKLTPFLQTEKCGNRSVTVLRVGGRLLNAPLEYDTKYPLLLPRSSRFVELYARYLHLKNFHAGPKVLLSLLRQKVWVVNGRELVRKIVRNCVHCFKYRPKLLSQIMGNLPKDRFHCCRPFLVSGVDFCGPIYTSYKIRGRPPYKSYVAIFVCFSSKAVHIEAVSDLSTDAFISVFKRFIGRRGLPIRLYCDNATNFVGASAKLKELREFMFNKENKEKIRNFTSENGVDFVFIPPRAPHFGGLWEAAVKSTKSLLCRTIANASLTFEQLGTILVEIEAILNSRPITTMTDDPNDGEVLTPAHLLIGTSLKTLPEVNETGHGTIVKQWQKISELKAQFWDTFRRGYFVELQERMKWSQPSRNVEVGAIVLIHEDNVPPQKWLYGRVVAVIVGPDGKVRVADIKTRNGVIRRAIHKLALVPIQS